MTLSITRHDAVLVASLAFPALVIVQCAAFFILPFLVPLLTGAAIALYGAVISALVLRSLWSKRGKGHALAGGMMMITWLGWIFIPTHELALHVRFWLERPKYEEAVAQIARGGRPACMEKSDCMVVGNAAPYIVFPFPGSLTAWIGVVHVPEPGQAPDTERLKSVASDPGCDATPIAPHYYVCGFY